MTDRDEVDEQLAHYNAMRDFTATAEPDGSLSGGAGASWTPAGGLPFVIQKHAATRLHYDFRLGWRGILKSWACAKGPSYNTHDKRLAVQVEDHPIEYGGFEGIVPNGQYGGGTVLLWDQGIWEPLPGTDFDEGLRKGSLKFTLHGSKLEGRWTLVRMGGRTASESKPNWLLIKEHDGKERNDENASAITDSAPDSVMTGRDLAAIAEAGGPVWNSRLVETGKTPVNHSRLKQKLKDAHLHGSVPAVTAPPPVTMPAVKEEQKPAPRSKPAARKTVANKALAHQLPGLSAQCPKPCLPSSCPSLLLCPTRCRRVQAGCTSSSSMGTGSRRILHPAQEQSGRSLCLPAPDWTGPAAYLLSRRH